MVNFIKEPSEINEAESVAVWSDIKETVESTYERIWDGVGKLPDGDNGNSGQQG